MTRRPIARLAASLLLAAAAGWGCSPGGDDLAGRIAAEVERGDGAVVDLAALTDFAWDRVHFFPPRTPLAQVTAELGFDWPPAPDMGLDEREHVILLVFVRAGEVVHFLPFRRYDADFAGPFPSTGYTPEGAVFVAREEPGGYARWTLRPRDSAAGRQ
jgi:hypothetical protein